MQGAAIAGQQKMETSLTDIENQLASAKEEARFTSQALTETLAEKDDLKAVIERLKVEMEAERSRNRIEVRQLEGMQREMIKDLESREQGEAATIEAEKASMQAKLALEQVKAEALEAQKKAQAEARELSCEVLFPLFPAFSLELRVP